MSTPSIGRQSVSATSTTSMESPLGLLALTAVDGQLTGISLAEGSGAPARSGGSAPSAAFGDIVSQLDAYFAGDLTDFDVPLALVGTNFQQQVWKQLRQIPYGETISYRELACWVGNPNAARAVGSANGRNPVAIIVPCHRVIAADGGIGGYGWGVDRKEWLLEHEAACSVRRRHSVRP